MKNKMNYFHGLTFLFVVPMLFSCSPNPTTPSKAALSYISISDDKVTEYTVGDTFIAPEITAHYEDNSSQVVTNAIFSDYDLSIAGNQFVNVTYTEGEVTSSNYYKITVKPAPTPSILLESIAVTGTKTTSYLINDEFVKPEVTAYYSDSSYKTVNATFTGYNMASVGTQTVQVSYTEGEITKTTSYQIVVNAAPVVKTLSKIEITGEKKTSYQVNDEFIKPEVTAYYSDGSSKVVEATFTGYNMAVADIYLVNVSYTESEITKSLTYSITVHSQTQQLDVKDIDPMLESSSDYLKFFNHSTSLNISISMSREAAEFMNNYQTSNDSTYHDYYVPCEFSLSMDGVNIHYDDVGIRVKGNMSRQRFLDNGKFSRYNLSHFKLKFCETFDGEEYDLIEPLKIFKKTYPDKDAKKVYKNRRLFDMEKLNIKWNRNNDDSKSKQGFILETFENNGVLTGKSTLSPVSLKINNTTPINATYEIYEDIDDVFISRHFKKEYAEGDLYKCTYQNKGPANFNKSYTVGNQIGVEDNTINYHPSYDLKTNKKKSDHSALTSLIALMNQDSYTASKFEEEISKRMDMQSFMMYEAIAFLGGNFDDLRNNGNNYYLYFVSGTNYCYVIPYDFDRCFGCGVNGYKEYMTNFSIDTTKMQCTGDWQNMSIYWRTVCRKMDGRPSRVDNFYKMYTQNIEHLLNDGIVDNTSFTNFVNKYPSSYRGNPQGAGNGNISFANYLNLKIAAIRANNKDDVHIK